MTAIHVGCDGVVSQISLCWVGGWSVLASTSRWLVALTVHVRALRDIRTKETLVPPTDSVRWQFNMRVPAMSNTNDDTNFIQTPRLWILYRHLGANTKRHERFG